MDFSKEIPSSNERQRGEELEQLLQLLWYFFPSCYFKVVNDSSQIIILVDKMIGYPSLCLEKESLEEKPMLQDYLGKSILSGETGVDFCVEVATPSQNKIYIITQEGYPKIQGKGIQMRSAKVKQRLQEYFKNLGSADIQAQQAQAADIIAGKYELLMPIIAGIKPAGIPRKLPVSLNLLENLGLESSPFKNNGIPSDEETIIYHPAAVKQIVAMHADIFKAINIDETMKSQDIIERTLAQPYALTPFMHSPQFIKAIGIILGFDSESSTNFVSPQRYTFRREFFGLHNIWGVTYEVKLDENKQFKALKMKYDLLLQMLENLLGNGLSPSEVLEEIVKERTINKIRHASEFLAVKMVNYPNEV